MEKIKESWLRLIRWRGWSAWLKWSGWKKIGAWAGWRKMLFPHPAVVIILSVIAFGGVIWVFVSGSETSPLAGIVYAAAFYALMTLTALIVKGIPALRKRYGESTIAKKIAGNKEVSFARGLYMEQIINLGYGIFKISSGIYHGSAWIGGDGIYNLVQGLMQLYQILRRKKDATMRQQWKSYRACGGMTILLQVSMSGMMYQMIHMGRHEEYPGYMIFVTAIFTFYKLIKSFIGVAKDRRHKQPVDSAVRLLDLSQAFYSIFVLQVGMIWEFGETQVEFAYLMNSLTGYAVSLLVVGMGVYMIWRANRDMKKLEDKEIG